MRQSRVTGWSGIAFAAIVIALNVVENAVTKRPDPAATGAEVAAWAADASVHLWVATVLVPLAWVLLPVFTVGLFEGARHEGDLRFPALLAALGSAMTMGTLSTAVAADAVLVARSDALGPAGVDVLSSLASVLFVFNWAALAVALYGVGRVAAGMGLLPRWLDRGSLAGAGLLLAGSLGAGAMLTGHLAPLLLGLAGFAAWLLVLVVTGVRLIRVRPAAAAP
jgi:hypothetical protein